MVKIMPRFDWYSATLSDSHGAEVANKLARVTNAGISLGKGRFGYRRKYALEHDGETLVNVYSDSATPGEVHIEIMSVGCDKYVQEVRQLWPLHRVSRADSAEDFLGDFEELKKRCIAFAEERSIKHRLVQDSDGGATLYLGATSSEYMVRLYKKSEQLRAKFPQRSDIPDGVLRLELQARPSKSQKKERLATMEAGDLFGLSKWTSSLANEVLGQSVEYVKLDVAPASDWSNLLFHLSKQYSPSILRRLETHSPDEVYGEVLQALGL